MGKVWARVKEDEHLPKLVPVPLPVPFPYTELGAQWSRSTAALKGGGTRKNKNDVATLCNKEKAMPGRKE